MTTSFFNISTYSRFNLSESLSDIHIFVKEYKERIMKQLAREEESGRTTFKLFADSRLSIMDLAWLADNEQRYFKDTANNPLTKQDFLSDCGFINCLIYTPDGEEVIVGHSSGLIQMRHGSTGVVLCTLRNIQFPPKPVYALEYSKTEERVCYASCMDGAVYRIEIPQVCWL